MYKVFTLYIYYTNIFNLKFVSLKPNLSIQYNLLYIYLIIFININIIIIIF